MLYYIIGQKIDEVLSSDGFGKKCRGDGNCKRFSNARDGLIVFLTMQSQVLTSSVKKDKAANQKWGWLTPNL